MPEKLPHPESGEEHNEAIDETLEQAIRKFFDYLAIRDEPQKSDAIFVLGGASLDPVKKAEELYRLGFATKICFISTGGKFGGEKVWGMPETQKYKETLREAGVPEEDIVTEDLTTNTLAEAKAAIPFLRDRGMEVKKIILTSRPVHQRRAYATFREQHPDIEYINCPADEELNVADSETQVRLVQEAERLIDYAKKGDIEKQDIPRDILEVAVIIRRELKKRGDYTLRQKPEIK